MAKPKTKPYPQHVVDLMAEKTAVLSKARALADLGMPETAVPLWASAASYEERLAPLLEALGREQEAAVHRVSAASCYQKAGEFSRAANLYRAALAGPLRDGTRDEVLRMLADCLAELAAAAIGSCT
jgi:tetratricopeptide (TPR) repeat protein